MGMAIMCEGCKTVYLEGDTIVPQCDRCPPEDNDQRLRGMELVAAWFGAIVGSWAVAGGLLFGILWVLQ